MPKNGLSKEHVVQAAAALIERNGIEYFSMRALADDLKVKTASLYNHVRSMETLMTDVCAYALRMQRVVEMKAIGELLCGECVAVDEAILALARSYRAFALEHRQLYRLVTHQAALCEGLSSASQCIIEPFLAVLAHTRLTECEKYHWQRILRALIHGFLSQEDAGFFSHLPVSVDESFATAIQCYIDGLTQAEKRHTE